MSGNDLVSVRYMVDDVDEVDRLLRASFRLRARPQRLAGVRGGHARAPAAPARRADGSAGRPMPDGRNPEPGGWNRIHFVVEDIAAEVERLRRAGVTFRNEIVSGPGGRQILVDDPSGNPIELFQPA